MSFDTFCDFHSKWGEPKRVLTSVKINGAARDFHIVPRQQTIINISVSFDEAFI